MTEADCGRADQEWQAATEFFDRYQLDARIVLNFLKETGWNISYEEVGTGAVSLWENSNKHGEGKRGRLIKFNQLFDSASLYSSVGFDDGDGRFYDAANSHIVRGVSRFYEVQKQVVISGREVVGDNSIASTVILMPVGGIDSTHRSLSRPPDIAGKN